MKDRVNKALRYADEYLNRKRYNPRLCLTVKESEIVAKALPSSVYLRKGNLLSNDIQLYMWKIIQF